eukprot:scaffold1771_cov211-Alexandrium_tamarense.AAC.27
MVISFRTRGSLDSNTSIANTSHEVALSQQRHTTTTQTTTSPPKATSTKTHPQTNTSPPSSRKSPQSETFSCHDNAPPHVTESRHGCLELRLVGMDGFVVRLVLAVGSSVEEGREEGIDVMEPTNDDNNEVLGLLLVRRDRFVLLFGWSDLMDDGLSCCQRKMQRNGHVRFTLTSSRLKQPLTFQIDFLLSASLPQSLVPSCWHHRASIC